MNAQNKNIAYHFGGMLASESNLLFYLGIQIKRFWQLNMVKRETQGCSDGNHGRYLLELVKRG